MNQSLLTVRESITDREETIRGLRLKVGKHLDANAELALESNMKRLTINVLRIRRYDGFKAHFIQRGDSKYFTEI